MTPYLIPATQDRVLDSAACLLKVGQVTAPQPSGSYLPPAGAESRVLRTQVEREHICLRDRVGAKPQCTGIRVWKEALENLASSTCCSPSSSLPLAPAHAHTCTVLMQLASGRKACQSRC